MQFGRLFLHSHHLCAPADSGRGADGIGSGSLTLPELAEIPASTQSQHQRSCPCHGIRSLFASNLLFSAQRLELFNNYEGKQARLSF